ncbi:MAG: FliH/SctL family protein [Myxococcota bacterium]
MTFKFAQSPVIRAADSEQLKPVPFLPQANPAEQVPGWFQKPCSEATEPRPWSPFGQEEPSPAVDVPEEAQEAHEGAAEQLEQAYQEAFAQGSEEGYAEGLAKGQADGEAQALEQAEAELEQLREIGSRLEAEVQKLSQEREQLAEQFETDAVKLALLIGSRLAAEAQLTNTEWVVPLVRDAAQALTDSDRVVCAVSPELAERLQSDGVTLAGNGVLMEVRESLDPLDVVVESRFGRVDASFEERLEHLQRVVEEHMAQPTESDAQEVA